MAIRPDYDIGTVTLVASSANFTTTGASLQTAAVQAGDAIITPSGHVLIIASVTGQNSGTLFLPCPAGAAGTNLPLRIRFQPDGSRYQGAVRNLVDLISSGNVEAFAALVGAAGLVPMFTGPGALDLVDPATFGIQDPNGVLANILAYGSIQSPQGRLSLVNGVSVPQSDVSAATVVYYVPAIGNLVPLFDGTSFVIQSIGNSLSVALSAATLGAFAQVDWFVFLDGTTVRLGFGNSWSGQFVRGGQISQRNGIWVNSAALSLRFGPSSGEVVTVPASQATYVGSTGGAPVAGTVNDSRYIRGLYNSYNQVSRPLLLRGDNTTWTYSDAAFRVFNSNGNNKVAAMCGLPGTPVSIRLIIDVASTVANTQITASIGLDRVNAEDATQRTLAFAGPSVVGTPVAHFDDTVGLGFHNFYPLEYGNASAVQTWRFFAVYGMSGEVTL
ncbi:hypothetical protein OIV19_20740 [Brucella sp. HL-2]|nr:hypothetical protein [Brucella sp. HL-2]MCV9910031.1 hypothetical protein [Brucella sp. HL-2]